MGKYSRARSTVPSDLEAAAEDSQAPSSSRPYTQTANGFPRRGTDTDLARNGGEPASQQSPSKALPMHEMQDIDLELHPEGFAMTSANLPTYQGSGRHEKVLGMFFKYLMWVTAIGPWKAIKGLSWLLNCWQRFVSPISYGIFHIGDGMDKNMPTIRAIIIWFWNTVSVALHFVDVFLIFAVINILSTHGHRNVSFLMGFLYWMSHYLMGVIMYMENDRPLDCPVYTFVDLINFCKRQVDVLFFDIQLVASVIHSNIMIEGTTQMTLQGYEECRVALHMIFNSLPACIILGVLYDAAFAASSFEWILDNKSYQDIIYAAFLLAVLNVFEKFIRMSIADPWLHPGNSDGYPLCYMRSNAARLPRAMLLDFVFRCNVQLVENNDRLVLKPLFDKYIINVRGEPKELADGHRVAMLRKALRMLNSKTRVNRAEVLARKLDQHIMKDRSMLKDGRTIREIDASTMKPGPHFPTMLEEVLAETTGFDVLLLADNRLSDDGVSHIVEGMRHNLYGLKIRHLDLSCNEVTLKGAEALATYIMQFKCLEVLNLSNNIELSAAGIKAISSVLNEDTALARLDLSGCNVGPEGAAALGAMLKGNKGLRDLLLSNARLGSAGVDSICKGLAQNAVLRDLDVSKSGADDKAASSLAQALRANNTLQKVSIASNRITDAGAQALADALQANTGLHAIDTSGCPMDKSWRKLLNNIMRGQGGLGGGQY